MARLNVDYKRVRNDSRFIALARKVGGEGEAWERLLRFWDMAQEHWGRGELLLESKFLISGDLEPIIEVGLAERRPDGIYARGSEGQFAWYVQVCEASKKGVASRKIRKGAGQPCGKPSGKPSGQPAGQPHGQPIAVNPLDSSLCDNKKSASFAASQIELFEPTGSQVWEAYKTAYRTKYQVEPVRNAKANALCKQLVKRLGGDGAVSVVKFYLTHNKSWYVQNVHSLEYCVKDCEALHTQWLGDRRVSASEAQQTDQRQATMDVFQRVAAKLQAEEDAKRGAS